jgi:hypothetical protein
VYPSDGWNDRFGSGGENQFVVVEPEVLRFSVSTGADAFLRAINFQGFGFYKDLHIFHLLEESRIAHYPDGRAH